MILDGNPPLFYIANAQVLVGQGYLKIDAYFCYSEICGKIKISPLATYYRRILRAGRNMVLRIQSQIDMSFVQFIVLDSSCKALFKLD